MAHFLVVMIFAITVFVSFVSSWKSKISRFKFKVCDRKKFQGNVNLSDESRKVNWVDTIPGPKPLPIRLIGNILQLQPIGRSIKVFFQWCSQYPNCFKFVGLNKEFIIFNSAPMANALLKSSSMGHINKSFMYDCLKPFMTSGLIVANGEFWQHHRKILNRSMLYGSLRGYMNMLNHHSKKLTRNLDALFLDGEPHQINVLLNCTAVEIISEIITGSNAVVDEADVVEYHHNFQAWKASVIRRLMKPWLLIPFIWKRHPMSKEYYSLVDNLHKFARKIISVHSSADVKENSNDDNNNNTTDPHEGSSTEPPYESMLSDLRRGGVPEQQILEEVNSLLIAGHETVASTMHFLCFLLALEPEIQENCRREIDAVFDDPMLRSEEDGSLTFEALASLKYLERCIMETLRIFPPVYVYLRQLDAPLPLKVNEENVELPTGTNVVVIPSALHMKPEYFPKPRKFNPDRFLPEEVVKRPVGSYIPFSGGPRGCLGRKFAMMEMKMCAARILRHFHLRTLNKRFEIPINPYVTLTPKRDYTFIFVKRQRVNQHA